MTAPLLKPVKRKETGNLFLNTSTPVQENGEEYGAGDKKAYLLLLKKRKETV